ncbi:S-layer homology domain-containing protein [Phosphitispora fastidiosa]|uniref:S-layer homology domain-containing protein n=1 Tax=Phosphitispora fastidiosa TaxID=2837202 RepID=UPI001E5545BD|nr:S-layer homology domain-containing protein [Phosphitispora fastidiosa]MBU7006034.1 hypothetical protein [Phosphitispora fastidiosa]
MNKKIFPRRLLIAAIILLLLAAMPAGVFAVEDSVCQIGETTYGTFDAALAAVNDGETITLLDNIEHSSQITVTGKGITFDLNGFTLNVTNAAGTAVEVGSGGEVALTGEGDFNVSGNGNYVHGIYAHDGGKATVTNATVSSYRGHSAYAAGGGIIEVTGNASASGTHCRAAQADGAGSAVTVRGSATSVNSQGVFATDGGSITVTGDVTGHYSGAYADGAAITIGGNATSDAEGAYALGGGTITIGGDAVCNGDSGYGAYAAQTGSTVVVTGNAISKGNYGRGAFAGAGAAVTIHGDAISEGDEGYGAYASGTDATIDIEGNVSSEYGLGAGVMDSGSITIDGTITAETYIKLQDTVKVEADGEISGGYLVYTDDTSTVRTSLFAGNGTEEDPYLISTEGELFKFAQAANTGEAFTGQYFKQTADITLTENWVPIASFDGNYDGQNYAIDNLIINAPGSHYIGFIHTAGANALLENIQLKNVDITGAAYVGALVAYNYGTISGCSVDGEITGTWATGGLVGQNYFDAVLEDCETSVNVTGSDYAGGLVGYSAKADISECSTSGNITGVSYVGGLIGCLQGGSLNGSFSLCTVSGTGNYTGGLIGQVDAANGFDTSIENCYAISDVSGEADKAVGGLIGANYWGSLTNSYSVGTVNGSGDSVGGLTGAIYAGTQTISSYYDSDVTGLSDTGKGIPKTTLEMKEADTYEGWDFPGIWTINSTDNDGYPALAWQGFEHQAPEPDATLAGLAASGITLTPEFDSAATDYSANVSNSTAGTTITAETGDPLATISIDDTEGTSKEVTLAVGENTVTILVIAADGITTKTYTITINRAAGTSSGSSSYTPPAIVVTTEKTDGTTTTSTEVSVTSSSGEAEASISTAMVDALLNKAAAENGTSKGDIIGVSVKTPTDTTNLEVTIPQSGFDKIANESDAGLGITSSIISITFDGKAIETISGAAAGGNITVSAGIIDGTTLSEKDRAKVSGRPVYDLSVKNGDVQVSHFGGGHATVRIPYTLKQGENPNAVVIYYLSDDGNLKVVRGHFDASAGAVVLKTPHFSNFVIGHNPVSFSDVNGDAWYKDAVDFIAARGITSGTGDGIYSPDMRLTRGQFMVLLMNAYQIEPAGGSADSAENDDNTGNNEDTGNFADAGNTYYTNYLAAAKSLGIANGVGNNMFAPNKEITRQEMFVLLYNALQLIDELPAATSDKQLATFNDADLVAAWATEAMSALVKGGIISGSDNMLSPAETTTRAQMAQALYNLLAK